MAKQAITITIHTEVEDTLDSLVALKRKVAKLQKTFGEENVTSQTTPVEES